jgi:hypothetical protein
VLLHAYLFKKGIFMQNRKIRKLAKTLRSIHRKNKSWRKTSEVCKVLTADGRINPGLCKRIALDGYQPTDVVMSRLEQHQAVEPAKNKAKPKTRTPHPLSGKINEMAVNTMRAFKNGFPKSTRMQ